MKNKQKFAGFTLIELLVVIVIIGILATISVATFSGYQKKAKLAKAKQFATEAETKLKADTFANGLKMAADCPLDGVNGDGFSPCLTGYELSFYGEGYAINPAKFVDYTPLGIGKSFNDRDTISKFVDYTPLGIGKSFNDRDTISKFGIPTTYKDGVTIAGWFNNSADWGRPSASFYEMDDYNGFSAYLDMGKYNDSIVPYFGLGSGSTPPGLSLEGPLLPIEDKWHYLLGTYDHTAKVAKLYVDGELVAIQDATSVSADFPTGGFVGGISIQTSDKSYVDNVKVFPVPMVGVDPRVSSGIRTIANGGDEFDLS